MAKYIQNLLHVVPTVVPVMSVRRRQLEWRSGGMSCFYLCQW